MFSVEFALKVIATGLVIPSSAYLHDAWNKLDAVVLGVTVASMVGEEARLAAFFVSAEF